MKNQTYSYIYIPVYKMKQIYNPGADTAKWLVNTEQAVPIHVYVRPGEKGV